MELLFISNWLFEIHIVSNGHCLYCSTLYQPFNSMYIWYLEMYFEMIIFQNLIV